jgi:hypothetical protein
MAVPRQADFYLCGPAGFLCDLTAGLEAWGVATGRIHSETFGGAGASTPGVVGAPVRTPHLPEGPAGAGPSASFARSGIVTRWDGRFCNRTAAVKPPLFFDHIEFRGPTIPSQSRSEWLELPLLRHSVDACLPAPS